MSGFNIQEFKSVINSNNGLRKANHFLVEFPVPKGLNGTLSNNIGIGAGLLSFYCKSAVLPGIGILTQDIYRYGYGPIERKPYGTVVNDAMFAMYVDNENRVREWFSYWTNLIVNTNSSKGIKTVSGANNSSAYEFAYKDQYAVDITVSSFDPEGNELTRVVLIEAFPNFIGDVTVDWDAKNMHMIMPMSITYRDWYEETIASAATSGDADVPLTSVVSKGAKSIKIPGAKFVNKLFNFPDEELPIDPPVRG